MSVFVVLNKVSANRSCRVTQSQFQVSALSLMQRFSPGLFGRFLRGRVRSCDSAQVTHLSRKRSCHCSDSLSVNVCKTSIMSPPDYQYCCCCFPQLSLPGWCRCLYASMLMFRRRKKKHRLEISAPQDFQHRVHTSFDVTSGCYVGLPPQWQSVIDTLKRPRPLVDPSRITNVELGPKKVGWIISIISQGCCKCNGPVSDDQVPTPAQ